MRTRLLLAAVAATASLAACGSDDPTSPASATSGPDANKKAMLDFARCMRENGVDMPDPQFDGNRVMMRGPEQRRPTDKMRAAEKACAKYRDSVKPPGALRRGARRVPQGGAGQREVHARARHRLP